MIREVVSKCPVCAAPIYGPTRLDDRDVQSAYQRHTHVPGLATFACDCRVKLLAKLDADNQRALQALATLAARPDTTVGRVIVNQPRGAEG